MIRCKTITGVFSWTAEHGEKFIIENVKIWTWENPEEALEMKAILCKQLESNGITDLADILDD